MKNRIVGIIVLAVAAIVGVITFLFNRALNGIVEASCTHGPECPMYGQIDFQTYISLGFIAMITLIGLYLIFFGEERVEIIKKIRIRSEKKAEEKDYGKVTKTMTSEEKKIFNLVLEAKGAIFQSELNEKSEFDKVKVTRILDRLEGQGLIERRRRGMTNVVILK